MRRTILTLLLLFAVVAVVTSCGERGSDAVAQPTVASTAGSDPTSVPSTSLPPDTETTVVADPSTTTTVPGTTSAPTTTTLVPLDELVLELEQVASGFEAPVFATAAPDDARLFVVDQPGVVWVIDGADPEVFLDIRDQVTYGGERGLLGLAFPADHATSGRFYVNYTDGGSDTLVSEFTATGNRADPSSERIVLEVAQPANNHNGGMIAFGPDGYLWIGMGDGGGRDDRYGTGQDGLSLLGSMLRIDPTTDPYGIPADNPGVDGDELAPEVWAIGLRNPWRFSFDGEDLWIGDVGQNQWEEIDVVDVTAGAGLNFGWPRFEGSNCYLSSTCDSGDLVPPIYEYSHGEGCSVTGGYVYRGGAIPELDGHYLFGDYCSGWIRSLSPSGEAIQWFDQGTVSGLSSFGVDNAGEVYVTSLDGGLYRVARAGG